jgi:UDP-2,3-diacylglucosamine hydrolase
MIYFASDFHLGIDLDMTSRERESLICEWLDEIKDSATHIYLVGDLFDFWFEYKSVVPRGYVRLLGKLATLSDAGIQIEAFTGNHDMWMRDYFEKELHIPVHRVPIRRTFGKHDFIIGHGDGLGPGDKGYKFLKKVFANKACQWLFARLHPNFGIKLADFWSGKSRQSHGMETFKGVKNEWLVQYCESQLSKTHTDFFVFGHRHLPIECLLSNKKSKYINLGDWMYHMSYACYDGTDIEIRFYIPDNAGRLVKTTVELI